VFDWVILLVVVSLDSGSGDWQKKALHLPRPALVWRIRTGADKFGSKKWGIQRGIPVITGIPMKIVIAHHSPWNSSCIPQTYASNAISMGK